MTRSDAARIWIFKKSSKPQKTKPMQQLKMKPRGSMQRNWTASEKKSRSLESQLKALQQKMESVLAARKRLGIDEEAPAENINQNASRKSHHRWFSRSTKTGVLPVDGPVTKKYNEMIRSDLHPGIDFSVPTGTPVKAIQAGRVVQAGWNGRYGYQVTLHHYDDTFSCYAHLSAISVKHGNPVVMGQKIGSSGATGNTETPHLHFEVRTTAAAGDDIDPVAYLATLGVSVMCPTAADAVATPTTTPQAAVPQPTEFLVSAEIRRLRSHQESERAHAVNELQTLANELPHSIPNIIEALCSYIRRPYSEYGSEKRPPSVIKALGAVLVMPRPRDAPPPGRTSLAISSSGIVTSAFARQSVTVHRAKSTPST